MTIDERCERTELLVAECAHCRPTESPVWPAMYAGGCHTCAEPIEVGEPVKWSQGGTYVVHAHHR